ncbi:homospermidine synthase [Ramlibacter alkalitolerans]|uniref:Homospermidine synthase n=1 Tax=Ramlibacter alkalitolerans TaxID=2039631 RepID=A0ABS1JW89_9BURK|nr:saccharopine dehydrogenase C-terminal domain-containing protein [Ramlibacter alkalitolerans]MBL0428544.1 homospermidine synthase [Ramlibacter alkalitolerans]
MGVSRRLGSFTGRVVVLGFGSIGQAVLPLLFDSFGIAPSQVRIVTASHDGAGIARALGVELRVQPLTQANHEAVLAPLLGAGDLLLNVSVDVATLALVRFCQPRGVLYLDACCEPWAGRYVDPELPPTQRSNHALREEMLAFRRENPRAPTACITQGANPGLVSCFVKEALLHMAAELRLDLAPPASREQWAALAHRLDVKVIHIAERDTQVAEPRKRRGEFINTWSVDGFVDEGLQPSELGWGTHERHWPADALRHGYGSDAAILLNRPGIATRVRSWTPLQGAMQAFLVTHGESVSIPDYLTLRENGAVVYRPTVHYAYHPCDDTVASLHELAGRNWQLQPRQRIIRDEIVEGMDELGVLLMGNRRGVYWYGSRLTIAQARALAPWNNATSLQVVAGLLGALTWALRHPDRGVVEADEMDHEVMMDAARPYLGEVVGVWGDWTPLAGRTRLFPEPRDADDPWQFLNFRVT